MFIRRQGHAAGRRNQHEPGAHVTSVIQRIETAGDEGVVQRPDRQQPSAEQAFRQPQRREVQEQVVLGEAKFDMLCSREYT